MLTPCCYLRPIGLGQSAVRLERVRHRLAAGTGGGQSLREWPAVISGGLVTGRLALAGSVDSGRQVRKPPLVLLPREHLLRHPATSAAPGQTRRNVAEAIYVAMPVSTSTQLKVHIRWIFRQDYWNPYPGGRCRCWGRTTGRGPWRGR